MTPHIGTERCTCAMDGFTVPNDLHTSRCELWQNDGFEMGLFSWDAPMGRFVINREDGHEDAVSDTSPWANADEWVWDGDTPVCRVATAHERSIPTFTPAPAMCEHEQEAVDAMCNGAEVDEYGWVQLECGSWADTEQRVTYRKGLDEEGRDCWYEELWGMDPNNSAIVDITTGEIADCRCQPTKSYFCAVCGVTRDDLTDEWRFIAGRSGHTPTSHGSAMDNWGDVFVYGNTCTHRMDNFKFPKGSTTNVHASKVRKHDGTDTPDLGLYASNAWTPDCPAIFIPWTDYGLPEVDYGKAARAIKTAFDAAKNGDVVEVGCVGSHGRTGTILACMVILDDPDMTPLGAIAWTRNVHCKNAVECSSQEWFVKWFHAWAHGTLATFDLEEPGKWKGTDKSKEGSWVKLPNGDWMCEADVADPKAANPLGDLKGTPFRFNQPKDGNTAPGATANQRRRANKREQRREKAMRQKQQNKRNQAYVNRGR